uniref:Uncharacterized protein n=1 Tax=Palpitomonas bilix TaxID=652834 RepID=A0A7S3GBI7_9EUKA|mmetsp:Transcript_39243/g.100570  ORF Transcript_39243/g.100570 Transcript_39243/m.100570 type:complete len:298 (+) Transcript_39243:172-1065(+)
MASPKKGPVRGPPKGFSLTPLYNSAPSGLFVECEITDRHVAITAENTKTIYRNHVGTKSASAYKRMCDILVPLTANAQRIGTEEERKLLDQSIQLCQRLLIEVTLSEATKLVGRAEYEDALPGSIQALRFSLEIYGSGRSELIPCYILLAEANLGLSRFKQAEECLCNANWILIKTRDNDKKVKSILYRGFGRLYAAQGKREEALRQLANDVYYSSLRVGPEHVDTSGGYFYMARVFQDMGKIDCALSLSDKVVDIWYRHLRDIAIAAAEAEERGDSGTKELGTLGMPLCVRLLSLS